MTVKKVKEKRSNFHPCFYTFSLFSKGNVSVIISEMKKSRLIKKAGDNKLDCRYARITSDENVINTSIKHVASPIEELLKAVFRSSAVKLDYVVWSWLCVVNSQVLGEDSH